MDRLAAAIAITVLAAACSSAGTTSSPVAGGAPPVSTTGVPASPASTRTATTTPATTQAPTPTTSSTVPTAHPPPFTVTAAAPPAWLGSMGLPEDGAGAAEILPTPPQLADRRLPTVDLLPPPAGDDFEYTIVEVPEAVAARSTWHDDCPVELGDLRYVTVAFWGFDERHHTGELLVNAAVAEDLVEVFRVLHTERFPIEAMRIVRADELTAPPLGHGNNTTAFSCRNAAGSDDWSEHAFGLAIDINPFHNPYLKDGVLIPELSASYLNRDRVRPGMILAGGPVTEAFTAIGWRWGGDFRTLVDYHHFSARGR